MKSLSVFIAGTPKAQPRARRSKQGGMYDPGDAKAWKELVALAMKANKPDRLFWGPLKMEVVFYMPRPKNRQGDVWHYVKPDEDNMWKAVKDAITKAGCVWHDDCQVSWGDIKKVYTKPGLPVGCRITISELEE